VTPVSRQQSIAKNSAYNLAGSVVPMVTALVTVPLYIDQIGVARYGVLSIVWVLLGHFGGVTLGMSRATAYHMARLGSAPVGDRRHLLESAFRFNIILGAVGGALLSGIGYVVFAYVISVPPELHDEVVAAVPFIGIAIPIMALIAVQSGALEGLERFDIINAVSIVSSVLLQVVPLIIAYLLGPDLTPIVIGAVVARATSLLLLANPVAQHIPRSNPVPRSRSWFRPLFTYGAWISVNNLIGGQLVQAIDRVLIGGVLGPAAVAYYSVPFNLGVRTTAVPIAISRAIFPRLSATNPDNARALARAVLPAVPALMTPLTVVAIPLFDPFLTAWVGAEFASHATLPAQIMFIGFWITSMIPLSLTVLQAQGRARFVAGLNTVLVAPFAGLMWFGLSVSGLAAATVALGARAAITGIIVARAADLQRTQIRAAWFDACLVTLSFALARSTSATSVASLVGMTALAGVAVYRLFYTTPGVSDRLRGLIRRMSHRVWDRARAYAD
jgi:O-antigen/teichoic acid export membrane protein